MIIKPHDFWLRVCGKDTWERSKGHAQLDTPWNAFTSDDILVCSIWSDEIVTVTDDIEGKSRRFVKLGGRSLNWKGPAVKHGQEAQDNLGRAFSQRLRVIGYEAEPILLGENKKKIAHFYLDRVCELQRLRLLSDGPMIDRLKLVEHFKILDQGKDDVEIEEGAIFEIVPQKGKFPVADEVSQNDRHKADASSGGDDLSEDEGEGEGDYVGNLTNRDYAERVIPILIDHVRRQRDNVLRPLTYEELAALLDRRNKHGMPAPRGLGNVLAIAMERIDSLKGERFGEVPYLTTIVVAKSGSSRGLPGIGVRERWTGYDEMTKDEKIWKVMNEYSRILAFGTRWLDILADLGIAPAQADDEQDSTADSATGTGGWGGGESPQHKALKSYVIEHPELFGADSTWEAYEEYSLRSADTIDVFFKSDRAWIGVEVKSSVSDGNELDYQRGLFQLVKYGAVLKAQACADRLAVLPEIKVALALEGRLPVALKDVAMRLDLDVRENVRNLMK